MEPPPPIPRSESGHVSLPSPATAQGNSLSQLPPEATAPPNPLPDGGAPLLPPPQDGTTRSSDCQPDRFTGRFGNVPQVIGAKREVEGIYAHHIDNGKARRSDNLLHPPPHQLSQKYEREIKPPRKKYLQALMERAVRQVPTQPQPVLHPQPRPSGQNTTRGRDLPNTFGVSRNFPSSSFAVPYVQPTTDEASTLQQGGGDGSLPDGNADGSSIQNVHPEVIAAVKSATYHWLGRNMIITDTTASLMWLGFTEDERRHVVGFHNQCRVGETGERGQEGPSAHQSLDLDMDEDFIIPRSSRTSTTESAELAQGSTNSASRMQEDFSYVPGGAFGAASDPAGTSSPAATFAQGELSAETSIGVYSSVNVQSPLPYTAPLAFAQGGASSSTVRSAFAHGEASSSLHAASPDSVASSMYASPPLRPYIQPSPSAHSGHVQPSQPHAGASAFAPGGTSMSMHAPSQAGVEGSMYAPPPPRPYMDPSPFAQGGTSSPVAVQPSQPHAGASAFAPGGISMSMHAPSQAGVKGSMYAPSPTQPYTDPSPFAHSGHVQPSQPHAGASAFAPGGTSMSMHAPSQAGVKGSMYAPPPPRAYMDPSPFAQGGTSSPVAVQPSQPHAGASAFAPGGTSMSMYAPSQAGVKGSMYAPPPPRPYMDPSPFAHSGHVQPSQPHAGASAFAPRGTSGSIYTPQLPRPYTDQSAIAQGAPLPWGIDGDSGPGHMHRSQGVLHPSSVHSPAPATTLSPCLDQRSGGEQQVMNTTPPPSPPRAEAQHHYDWSLPFQEDVDLGPTADKGKGRAMDVDVSATSSSPDVMLPEESDHEPQLRPRLSFMDGPHGDLSGYMNPNSTLLFAQQIQGLTSAIEDQTQEFRDFRDQFEPLLNTQPGSTDPPSPSPEARGPTSGSVRERKLRSSSSRTRKRQRRIEKKVARLRGTKSSSCAAVSGEETTPNDETSSEDLNRLRARMRRAFNDLLHITDWDDVHHLYPPLTEDELALYKARDASIVPTATNFRIDFHHGWKKPFNKEAREVFIDRYLERVQNGAYAKNPTPPVLLTRDFIGEILDKQMPNYRQKWRRAKTPLSAEKKAITARAGCQRSRKRTLHESREALLTRRGLTRHVRFFKLLEPVNMSGDETDGDVKTHPPKWRIRVARWQSTVLKNFLWEIDRMYREDWGRPAHRRATGGNPPRDRVHRADCYEDGVAPIGLWRNCYDEMWLEAQAPHVVRELEIEDEDYDFTL